MPQPLGTYDAFKNADSWNSETARMWVSALNLRAAAADQIALRHRLIGLANLKQGDTTIEIGCGTGALLCDLARAVGEEGRAIGIEPQTALAEAARARISNENLSASVQNESATRGDFFSSINYYICVGFRGSQKQFYGLSVKTSTKN